MATFDATNLLLLSGGRLPKSGEPTKGGGKRYVGALICTVALIGAYEASQAFRAEEVSVSRLPVSLPQVGASPLPQPVSVQIEDVEILAGESVERADRLTVGRVSPSPVPPPVVPAPVPKVVVPQKPIVTVVSATVQKPQPVAAQAAKPVVSAVISKCVSALTGKRAVEVSAIGMQSLIPGRLAYQTGGQSCTLVPGSQLEEGEKVVSIDADRLRVETNKRVIQLIDE